MLHRRPIIRTGYCKKCDQETLHSHESAGLLSLFHFLTLQLLPRFGIGKWVCVDCYSESLLLNTFSRNQGGEEAGKNTFELDGNYIVNEFSLVRRSLRNSRYSMKFRDSIVDRLVNGQVDLSTIRAELNLRETDVFAWIADRLSRQSEKISQLTSLIEVLADQRQNQLLESDIELENCGARSDDVRHPNKTPDIAGSRSHAV